MSDEPQSPTPDSPHLLEVTDLRVEFKTKTGPSRAVDGVSFYVDEGESLGIVGESGCGKSVTAMGILRLIASTGRIASGSVMLDGEELTELSNAQMRAIRGKKISMIHAGSDDRPESDLHDRLPGR